MLTIDRHITRREVADKFGVSISTIDRLRKNDPDFPTGITISKRNVRFSQKELHEYLRIKREQN